VDKPTDLMSQVMAGTADYNFLPKALQSAIRLPIYTRACAVLAEPTKEARRAKLNSEPESVRGLIETEALRLYKLRRKRLQ
jgi:hypothetical protein